LSDLDFSPHLSFTFAPQNAELVKSHLFILWYNKFNREDDGNLVIVI
jgi:hypothetical protein